MESQQNESQERAALAQWLNDRKLTIGDVSEAMQYDHTGVYRIVTGRRPVNDSFKWRFAQTYGWEEATRLFGVTETPAEA